MGSSPIWLTKGSEGKGMSTEQIEYRFETERDGLVRASWRNSFGDFGGFWLTKDVKGSLLELLDRTKEKRYHKIMNIPWSETPFSEDCQSIYMGKMKIQEYHEDFFRGILGLKNENEEYPDICQWE